MTFDWTKSLRFQLTLWSLATTALILLAASLLCFTLVRFALIRETDRALQSAAAAALRRLTPNEPAEPDDLSGPADPAAMVRSAPGPRAALPGLGAEAIFLRLVRPGSREAAAESPALPPGLKATLAALPFRPHAPEFAGTGDDTQLRCLTAAVPNSPYVLQAALPWDPAEDLLARLAAGLTGASLLVLVLSGGGTGLLVGRALRPIDRIVTDAERLTPDRLDSASLGPHALSDTEIGHLVSALNRLLARVAAAAESRRQFTADASHELRTPLTILRGQLELALSRPRSADEYRAAVESSLEETLRMTRIVDSLAFLARGEAAASAPLLARVSLAAIAAEVSETLAGRAAAKNVRLTTELSGDAAVYGEADALRRLIQNLVENAVAYTPPGGTVAVSVAENAADCILRVADTGIGIAPADLPHVFDRFFRADPARASTGGSGLGLSIVQSIAEAHGGGGAAESTPGVGSIFTVTLPRVT